MHASFCLLPLITVHFFVVYNVVHDAFLSSPGTDLIEADEDEVSSTLPDRPRSHRKASSKSVPNLNAHQNHIAGGGPQSK